MDLKLSRVFKFGRARFRGDAELYNVFNWRVSQGNNPVYGPGDLTPSSLLGGRLFKFGAQLEY